jgi:dienelactone hydrolase
MALFSIRTLFCALLMACALLIAAVLPSQAQDWAKLQPPIWSTKPDLAEWERMENDRIEAAHRAIDKLVAVKSSRTVGNTVAPYDEAIRQLDAASNFAFLMQEVHPDAAFRDHATAMNTRANGELSALSLNRDVYQALVSVDVSGADAATCYYIKRQLLEFRLAGVDKDDATRKHLKELNVRGGGEYGEEWHVAGKGANKANSWRDFIACAEYLVAQGYTSPAHMSCMGVSGGGILVGRAATERPDLFAAVIDWVGVTDMLRLETMATGAGNIPEFGSVKTETGFHDLYAMSAYHHVKDGVPYPAFLITTGINDPRVDPWQPAKMAARLHAATSSGKPVLLRVDYAAGHGNIGNTASQFDELLADTMSFEFWQLGVPEFQPRK